MMPGDVLSTTTISGPFLPPRTNARISDSQGLADTHYGGVAIGDPTQGIQYQLWTVTSDGNNVSLQSPNTEPYVFLADVGASWVALAFDQNSQIFISYATAEGAAYYYWYDSTVPGYVTTQIPGTVFRVFAALDDARPLESRSADILLNYVRGGVLYQRVQRDRYGVEYDLATVAGNLVQVGLNTVNRFQFEFVT